MIEYQLKRVLGPQKAEIALAGLRGEVSPLLPASAGVPADAMEGRTR